MPKENTNQNIYTYAINHTIIIFESGATNKKETKNGHVKMDSENTK